MGYGLGFEGVLEGFECFWLRILGFEWFSKLGSLFGSFF